MADRVGQQLGNYRLTRLLGRGGFAEVYLGEHLRLKTQAAIKVLHTSLEEDDEEGFLREAQTVARLKHPHIVRVFDFDVENHTPFLVMDYLPNGNVRRSHPKGTPLPLETIISYVKQVASALQYAHDEKLIHWDIKPENMLLDKGDTVVLSDFGIALTAQSSRYQSTQEVAGTAAYMAPEQFQGKPRRASDQYALGVVVYEWLTGDRPFHGSFSEIASQHLFVPPPSLRSKVPTISPDVEQVVLTALDKDPHKRFESVKAFATALEQASLTDSIPTLLPLDQSSGQTNTGPSLVQKTVPAQIWDTQVAPTIPEAHTLPKLPDVLVSNRPITRRKVLIGIGGLAGLTAGIIGLEHLVQANHSSGSTGKPSPNPIPGTTPAPEKPSPSPTPDPTPTPGRTIYTLTGYSNGVEAVAWSPDGKEIASGDTTVQLWDAATGNHKLTYSRQTSLASVVAWSPDSREVASSLWYDVQVWNAATGATRLSYPQPPYGPDTIAWSPDGKEIASGSSDTNIQVWDAITGDRKLTHTGHTNSIRIIAWSPDGKEIASCSDDHTVQVWDAATGTTRLTYTGHSSAVFSVAWSPDGKEIASAGAYGDKTVQVWDAATGDRKLTYTGHSNAVFSVAWSPDGKEIASGAQDSTVQVWDAATGDRKLTYTGHSDTVTSVAWSPDGKEIASGSWDKTVQVWQAE